MDVYETTCLLDVCETTRGLDVCETSKLRTEIQQTQHYSYSDEIRKEVSKQHKVLLLSWKPAMLCGPDAGDGREHVSEPLHTSATKQTPYLTACSPVENREVNKRPVRNNSKTCFALSSHTCFPTPRDAFPAAAGRSIRNRATMSSITSRTACPTLDLRCYDNEGGDEHNLMLSERKQRQNE